MSEKVFHFVRHHEVSAFERVGWIRHNGLDDTHHGRWSELMEWKGEGEPVKPFFTEARETNSEADDLARAVEKTNE